MTVLFQANQKYFCYLIIQQKVQQWIGFFFIIIAILLTIKSIYQLKKAHHQGLLNLPVKFIYISIIAWALVYAAKLIFSQFLYMEGQDNQQTHQSYSHFSIASKYIFVLDIFGVYLVQSSLIFTCYNWVANIIIQTKYFEASNEIQESKSIKIYKVFKKFLKFYLALRILFLSLLIPFCIFDDPQQQNGVVKTVLSVLLIEAYLVFLILLVGYFLIKQNSILNQFVQVSEINTLSNRYIILIICGVIRCILDTIFVKINFSRLSEFSKCYINSINFSSQAETTIKFIFQGLLTHFLPIYIILRIYNVANREIDMSQSLIIASMSNEEDQEKNKN